VTDSLDPAFVWALVATLGLGTFTLRLSFIGLYAWFGEFPPRVARVLAFVPAAVLAALVGPAVLPLDALLAGVILTPRVVAALLATVVAWRTGSFTATIVVGMVALWTLEALPGLP
jgi:branched-subunit amino acid transport protein